MAKIRLILGFINVRAECKDFEMLFPNLNTQILRGTITMLKSLEFSTNVIISRDWGLKEG
ncbi:hypothetical protein [Staphylococcus ursi]|uniref:hypothetical protein n=1 Tax=Staphylococcus sp. MI 10-1553 TaxID=1912064 RepID=UPI001939A04C|nr:hypothetical protein [Staphylococcus sp. MI 10-1553]